MNVIHGEQVTQFNDKLIPDVVKFLKNKLEKVT